MFSTAVDHCSYLLQGELILTNEELLACLVSHLGQIGCWCSGDFDRLC